MTTRQEGQDPRDAADDRPVVEWAGSRKKTHKWGAWAGGKDDLARIGDRVTRFGEAHRKRRYVGIF
jgi:hypothetical protein